MAEVETPLADPVVDPTISMTTTSEELPQTPDAIPPDSDEKPMSARERIRAKLRAQEARFSTMVRHSSGSGTGILSHMADLEGKMKQVEQQNNQLEEELHRLRHATDGDDFLREKMEGIQEGFEKQVEKIQSLEDQLEAKESEVDGLRREIYGKLHRIVELEFDLQTHNIHYTNYASEQFRLGEAALEEIRVAKDDEALVVPEPGSSLAKIVDPSVTITPRRAQRLISKLLSDLDDLESRYKTDRLNNSSQIDHLKRMNEDLATKVQVLETKLKDQAPEEPDEIDGFESIDNHDLTALRSRIDTLTAQRERQRQETERLQSELVSTRSAADQEVERLQTDLEQMRLERDALKAKSKGDFEEVEKRIREAFAQVAKLEADVDIREQQIGTLKKEVAKLRVKELAYGDNAGDAAIVRANEGATDGADASIVQELQRQIREVSAAVVKKDQELVIERAKSASTAAALLARITELTAPKPSVEISDDEDEDIQRISKHSTRGSSASVASSTTAASVREQAPPRRMRFLRRNKNKQ